MIKALWSIFYQRQAKGLLGLLEFSSLTCLEFNYNIKKSLLHHNAKKFQRLYHCKEKHLWWIDHWDTAFYRICLWFDELYTSKYWVVMQAKQESQKKKKLRVKYLYDNPTKRSSRTKQSKKGLPLLKNINMNKAKPRSSKDTYAQENQEEKHPKKRRESCNQRFPW